MESTPDILIAAEDLACRRIHARHPQRSEGSRLPQIPARFFAVLRMTRHALPPTETKNESCCYDAIPHAGKNEGEGFRPWLGAMRLPTKANDADVDEEAVATIRHAIDRGVNYLDTAYVYHSGKGEAVVGGPWQWLPPKRSTSPRSCPNLVIVRENRGCDRFSTSSFVPTANRSHRLLSAATACKRSHMAEVRRPGRNAMGRERARSPGTDCPPGVLLPRHL